MPRKRVRTLGEISVSLILPMLCPLWCTETTSEPRSCTAPMNTDPSTTHRTAGTQPQITAMAGPSIGAAPAMEA